MSRLAIVVVNYGDPGLLRDNLVPLGRSIPDAVIVVVDNLTTATHRSTLLELAAAERWQTVLPDGNTGFGGGMNLGVAAAESAGATQLLLLNPDAAIVASSVAALMTRSEQEPLTMVSPRILRPDGSTWFDGSDLYLADGRIRSRRRRIDGESRPWLSGACLMLSAELFRRVGGFDEEFFLYWEDVDLSWRVTEIGGRLMVADDATAVHAQGGTQASHGAGSAGQAKSDAYYFYNIRNRMLFAARHLPSGSLRQWLRLSPRVAWEILLQGGRRQFVSRPTLPLVAMRAVRAGKRIARDELRRRASNGDSATETVTD